MSEVYIFIYNEALALILVKNMVLDIIL